MILEKANPITIRLDSILEPARNLPVPDPGSRAPVLNWAQATQGFGSVLHTSPANHIDADAYHIALIPIEIGKDGASLLSPQSGGVGLLLPLTWRDIASQINNHPGHPERWHAESVVQFGEVRINFLTMEVYRSKQLLTFTAMDFKTLKFFVLNPFRVFSRDELLNEVWGYENYPCTRTVDNRVMRLRQKLEADPVKPLHFRTVHGVGYKFVP
jgi:DNA-binding winged helix-turn-helix (wHTH) protein